MSKPTSQTESCCICWMDDVACSDFQRLQFSCGHGFCRSCICDWFRVFETPRGLHYTHTPSCPTCRQTVNAWDAVRIMGRPIRKPEKVEVPPSPDNDQLFLAWLSEQGAQQCPKCQMWVLREDGCNHMMCRCGQSFCYHCGEPECKDELYQEDEHRYWWQLDDEPEWPLGSRFGDNAAAEEFLMMFLRDGAKASFGGKSALLWKGNQWGSSRNRRRKKGKKRSKGRKEHGAQRMLLAAEIAETRL